MSAVEASPGIFSTPPRFSECSMAAATAAAGSFSSFRPQSFEIRFENPGTKRSPPTKPRLASQRRVPQASVDLLPEKDGAVRDHTSAHNGRAIQDAVDAVLPDRSDLAGGGEDRIACGSRPSDQIIGTLRPPQKEPWIPIDPRLQSSGPELQEGTVDATIASALTAPCPRNPGESQTNITFPDTSESGFADGANDRPIYQSDSGEDYLPLEDLLAGVEAPWVEQCNLAGSFFCNKGSDAHVGLATDNDANSPLSILEAQSKDVPPSTGDRNVHEHTRQFRTTVRRGECEQDGDKESETNDDSDGEGSFAVEESTDDEDEGDREDQRPTKRPRSSVPSSRSANYRSNPVNLSPSSDADNRSQCSFPASPRSLRLSTCDASPVDLPFGEGSLQDPSEPRWPVAGWLKTASDGSCTLQFSLPNLHYNSGQPLDLTHDRTLTATTCLERPAAKAATSSPSKRKRFTKDENKLLIRLKEGTDLSWEEITRYFERTEGSLQVHYHTKLKHRQK